ncbi:unnamed protein product [Ilex paraguariensis]|uniref:Uncharacterized protein n=1 Tax=Ilex paraguariensis TaxID=185542 RepID=A0ABC8RSW0_9AQUA
MSNYSNQFPVEYSKLPRACPLNYRGLRILPCLTACFESKAYTPIRLTETFGLLLTRGILFIKTNARTTLTLTDEGFFAQHPLGTEKASSQKACSID